jgi:hypothetical protein
MTQNERREAKEVIAHLRRLHAESRKHEHGKYGFVKYLTPVNDLYNDWRKTPGKAKRMRKIIGKLANLPAATQQKHTYNVLIAATTTENKKTQSRWALGLQYARRKRRYIRQHHLTLEKFFLANGGVAGCATKFSQQKKAKRN